MDRNTILDLTRLYPGSFHLVATNLNRSCTSDAKHFTGLPKYYFIDFGVTIPRIPILRKSQSEAVTKRFPSFRTPTNLAIRSLLTFSIPVTLLRWTSSWSVICFTM